MAEAGHGVAIIPSAFRTHRYMLELSAVTYRGRPLREPLTILWDKRRPLPRYATAFCQMLAEHVREVFPITRPTEPMAGADRSKPRADECVKTALAELEGHISNGCLGSRLWSP